MRSSRFRFTPTLVAILGMVIATALPTPEAVAQKKVKVKPDINKSKEFPGVYHSPSADSTPSVFRSVVQMELVVKQGDSEAKIQYANGTVVSKQGHLASIVAEPDKDSKLKIESASLLMLDKTSALVELVSFQPEYGLAIFKAQGV